MKVSVFAISGCRRRRVVSLRIERIIRFLCRNRHWFPFLALSEEVQE